MDRTAIGLILLFQWKWLSLSSISLCFKESFYTSFWGFLFPLIKIILTVIKGSTQFHHYWSAWSGSYSGRLVSESMMNREEGHDRQWGRKKKKIIMVSHVKPDESWLAVHHLKGQVVTFQGNILPLLGVLALLGLSSGGGGSCHLWKLMVNGTMRGRVPSQG